MTVPLCNKPLARHQESHFFHKARPPLPSLCRICVANLGGFKVKKKSRCTRLHRVNIYFRKEDDLKVDKYLRISSGCMFLYGRLCNQVVCKILPAEVVLFSSFIFGSIRRNLFKHDFGANSYAEYSLKCWVVWGFLGAWGEQQPCFGSHTQSPSPRISLSFQEMSIWLWKIHL